VRGVRSAGSPPVPSHWTDAAPGFARGVYLANGDVKDHRMRVLRVLIDGEQSLETRHTRIHERFENRP
jgi:hypothetical protein